MDENAQVTEDSLHSTPDKDVSLETHLGDLK